MLCLILLWFFARRRAREYACAIAESVMEDVTCPGASGCSPGLLMS